VGRNKLQNIKRRKTSCIGHILRRDCLLKHVIEGKYRGKDRSRGKTRKKAQAATGLSIEKDRILKIERGSTRSYSVENSLWKKLRNCR
jgi:hypothetical protein